MSSQTNPVVNPYGVSIELASMDSHRSTNCFHPTTDCSIEGGSKSYAPISGNVYTENGKAKIYFVIFGVLHIPEITTKRGGYIENGAKYFLNKTGKIQTSIGDFCKKVASVTVSSTMNVVDATSDVACRVFRKAPRTIQEQIEEEYGGYSGCDSNEDDFDLGMSNASSDDEYDMIEGDEALGRK